ncbi:MAG: DUF2490 domain-containing protein [Crocinitomicaceae bacterium]
MKGLILFVFVSFSLASSAQTRDPDEFMIWTEIGVKGKVIEDLSWSADINTRFVPGVQTFFPQIGLSYKIAPWFKPSIEYRFVVDKNKYDSYKPSSRLNFNLRFKHDTRRFYGSLRVRYQSSFNNVSSSEYDGDFDQAFRLKPAIEYKIRKSRFVPGISAEWFLNPAYGPGRGFTKVRLAAGTKIEIVGPHEVSVKFQLDKKTGDYRSGMRHVFSLGYSYNIGYTHKL